MPFAAYAEILRRRWWLILLGAALAAGIAFGTSELQEPVYQASVTLLISEAPRGTSSDFNNLLVGEHIARTYVQLLTSRPVLEEVILALSLQMRAQDLAPGITAQIVPDTQLINLQVEETDPDRAALIANSLARVFGNYIRRQQAIRFDESKKSLSAEIGALDQQIRQTQDRIAAVGQGSNSQTSGEFERLQADLAQYRESRTNLLQSYESLRLVEAQSTTNVIVVEEARPPRDPIRPRTLLNTGIAAIIGLVLAAGLATLLEYLDDTIATPDEAVAVLGLPMIAALPQMSPKTMKRGLVTLVEPRAPATEAYRALRTNIQAADTDRPLRRILITSAGPQEGKSTIVANLAVVMAQAGCKVAIVDADLRRPVQHKLWGRQNQSGTTEFSLKGQPARLDSLQPVGISNLYLLPSGALPSNPVEVLNSPQMSALLESLRQHVEWILLDSPPVLAVTDAIVLARNVDAVILVVEAGRARAAAVSRVKEHLERLGVKVIGVVLNKAPLRHGSDYYGYYADAHPESDPSRTRGTR